MINDAKNKMMTEAPTEKAGFHFPGDGVYHNVMIWAETLEEATKEYLNTRKPIVPASQATTTTDLSSNPESKLSEDAQN